MSEHPVEKSVEPDPKKVLHDYRALLINCEQKAQTDFDKTILTLSGGALGISFAFVEKLIGNKVPVDIQFLEGAWLAWVLSLFFVLVSYYLSAHASRHALNQLDAGRSLTSKADRVYDWSIQGFNLLGGLGFLAGAIAAGCFLVKNLG